MSTHIERMELELADLENKVKKGTEFLESEKVVAKYTDAVQRALLEAQMNTYKTAIGILKSRIEYDKIKMEVGL